MSANQYGGLNSPNIEKWVKQWPAWGQWHSDREGAGERQTTVSQFVMKCVQYEHNSKTWMGIIAIAWKNSRIEYQYMVFCMPIICGLMLSWELRSTLYNHRHLLNICLPSSPVCTIVSQHFLTPPPPHVMPSLLSFGTVIKPSSQRSCFKYTSNQLISCCLFVTGSG